MEPHQSSVLQAFGALPDSMPAIPTTSAPESPTPVYPAYPSGFPPTATAYPPPGVFSHPHIPGFQQTPAPFVAPTDVAPTDVAPPDVAPPDVASADVVPPDVASAAPLAAKRPPTTFGVTTRRLYYQGYSYSIKCRYENRGKIYWRCTIANASKCRAKCVSDFEMSPDSVILGKPHTCRPPATQEELAHTITKVQVLHNLKVHAVQCNDAPSSITSDIYGPCSTDVLEALPLRASAMRTVRKQRPIWIAPKDIHFEVSFYLFLLFF